MTNPSAPDDNAQRFDRLEEMIAGSRHDNRAHAMLAVRQIKHHTQAIDSLMIELERRLIDT